MACVITRLSFVEFKKKSCSICRTLWGKWAISRTLSANRSVPYFRRPATSSGGGCCDRCLWSRSWSSCWRRTVGVRSSTAGARSPKRSSSSCPVSNRVTSPSAHEQTQSLWGLFTPYLRHSQHSQNHISFGFVWPHIHRMRPPELLKRAPLPLSLEDNYVGPFCFNASTQNTHFLCRR